MKLTETTMNDIEQLSEWIKADPYHKDCLDPYWWLTGQGLLTFCLQDSQGPTMFVRLDADGDLLRLHCQFAPLSEVSKHRVVKTLMWAIPKMELIAAANSLNGFVYKSTSSTLIDFMRIKFSFVPAGNDDYVKRFPKEEECQ